MYGVTSLLAAKCDQNFITSNKQKSKFLKSGGFLSGLYFYFTKDCVYEKLNSSTQFLILRYTYWNLFPPNNAYSFISCVLLVTRH